MMTGVVHGQRRLFSILYCICSIFLDGVNILYFMLILNEFICIHDQF
jgi:hypothetical protein